MWCGCGGLYDIKQNDSLGSYPSAMMSKSGAQLKRHAVDGRIVGQKGIRFPYNNMRHEHSRARVYEVNISKKQ